MVRRCYKDLNSKYASRKNAAANPDMKPATNAFLELVQKGGMISWIIREALAVQEPEEFHLLLVAGIDGLGVRFPANGCGLSQMHKVSLAKLIKSLANPLWV